eukprot:TRINITY_DN2889_c0_g9_i1.p1 TRINITY_DN2889_c0_g9~~TRINITY_DN2889_c0_g9_i1.p1  ORF type:complete len:494 (-),score=120.16 TRINITY_DN2889_c0_g9_i1:123-1604(-)
MTRLICIAGPPASGKGTQCAMLREKFGMIHISVGDLLRQNQKNIPELKRYMDRGELVPDSVVVPILKNRLSRKDCQLHGALLDGFPRTLEQAQQLQESGLKIDHFVYLNVDDAVVLERITGRRIDPLTGAVFHIRFRPPPPELTATLIIRSDDTEEACRNRLAIFHKHMTPVLQFYRDVLFEVPGQGPFGEVLAKIHQHLIGCVEKLDRTVIVSDSNCKNSSSQLIALQSFFQETRTGFFYSKGPLHTTLASIPHIRVRKQAIRVHRDLKPGVSYICEAWLSEVKDKNFVIQHRFFKNPQQEFSRFLPTLQPDWQDVLTDQERKSLKDEELIDLYLKRKGLLYAECEATIVAFDAHFQPCPLPARDALLSLRNEDKKEDVQWNTQVPSKVYSVKHLITPADLSLLDHRDVPLLERVRTVAMLEDFFPDSRAALAATHSLVAAEHFHEVAIGDRVIISVWQISPQEYGFEIRKVGSNDLVCQAYMKVNARLARL